MHARSTRGKTARMTQRFEGVIADDSRDSTPWWPPEPTPPPGAPSVLLIVLDDVGFAQLGCYGSDIATPNIDAVAADGVRFANFHTTALCSPTRPSLMTGRNHHRHDMARVADLATGYHLSADLADRAIEFLSDLRAVDEQQPFFCYLATGACHSPHHAPPEWIARYKGQFDGGWDAWREATFARQREHGLVPDDTALSPRPSWVPAWDELASEDQAVAARFMECFAGFLSYTD